MLKEELTGFGERQRQFLLLRMVGIERESALSTLQIPLGTYKRWITQKRFQGIYRKIEDVGLENRDEALSMLRNANYALVVKLEEEMLTKLIEEIKTGQPNFAKTNLGREVYARLANEMSTKPNSVKNVTWEQLILQQGSIPQQLPQGDNHDVIEAETSPIEESPESKPQEADIP